MRSPSKWWTRLFNRVFLFVFLPSFYRVSMRVARLTAGGSSPVCRIQVDVRRGTTRGASRCFYLFIFLFLPRLFCFFSFAENGLLMRRRRFPAPPSKEVTWSSSPSPSPSPSPCSSSLHRTFVAFWRAIFLAIFVLFFVFSTELSRKPVNVGKTRRVSVDDAKNGALQFFFLFFSFSAHRINRTESCSTW